MSTEDMSATMRECKNGHPMTPDNVYTRTKPNGRLRLSCRTCVRAQVKEGYERRRATRDCASLHALFAGATIARFWSRVEERGDCWEWTGGKTFGYGSFIVKDKRIRAHRYSYLLHVGPIPDGLDLDHLCRNRACVNPRHLEPVTRQINLLRGEGSTAYYAGRTHCNHGHEFTPENTYTSKKGYRRCRTCSLAKCRAYKSGLKR